MSFKIGTVNLSSKCWVVRPGSRYRFVSEFIENEIIATGHLDNLQINELTFIEPITQENKARSLEGFDSIMGKNVKPQIENFVIDMQVGDVVFTLNSSYVIPGIIKSEPYYSRDSFSESEGFHVRRRVKWGEPIPRKKIPITIQKSFNAYQAIFSLGDNSKEVFHWLSSFFIDGNDYYSSLRIEQPGALKHHTLKQLAELIDRIQVLSIMISRYHSNEEINAENSLTVSYEALQSAMLQYSDEGLLDLTSQQILMSPGDLWLKFSNQSRCAGVAFLYLMLTITGINSAQALEFTNESHAQELEEIVEIIDANSSVLGHELDISSIRRQLMLKPAAQNSEFVDSNIIEQNDFPEDGDAIHIGG
ncbi:TPA: hypothetical protein VEO38_000767 [Providencia alcalifaciens]|nr:hypothetical protein [Providencia alcalifaciens]